MSAKALFKSENFKSIGNHWIRRPRFEVLLIFLRLVPHARTEDKNLRFGYAASRAIPPSGQPFGAPLHFPARLRALRLRQKNWPLPRR
jgi:hypothetical protein